jgi:ABC-type transporter Mla maintaining outer membrane lipid asymmetry ATPase subunit MlaF
MSGEPIIELKGVSVPSRRDAEIGVMEEVTWTVRAGEFWVTGGVQGTGKSDLAFMLAGLTKPLAGEYLLFGQDMGRHFGEKFLANRLRTALVFDDARLFGTQTVAENVALPVRYHQNLTAEESSTWVAALLEGVECADQAEAMPAAISRSWRRRVALARALALRPEVLFLENPLRGLDARHALWWIDFTTQLWRGHPLMSGKKMTVVATTDEFWPWRNSGAQFAHLRDKTLVETGATFPAEDMRFHPMAAGEEE